MERQNEKERDGRLRDVADGANTKDRGEYSGQ